MEPVAEATNWFTSFVQSNMVYIEKLPAALVTFIIAYAVMRLAKRAIITATSLAKVDRTVQTMIESAISFVGWVLILAAVFNVMDLSQLSLALGGSIALIAMALTTGLNNVTQDLLSGIFLLGDKEFATGKWVMAGGVEGRIEELTIRKTRIRDAQGNLHTIPNRNVDGGTYVILAIDAGKEAEEKAGA